MTKSRVTTLHRYIIIVDEITIIGLEIFFNIEKQLAKACGLSNFSIIVFGDLPIVIVMRDFYQFFPIADHLFWGKSQTDKDYNSKT